MSISEQCEISKTSRQDSNRGTWGCVIKRLSPKIFGMEPKFHNSFIIQAAKLGDRHLKKKFGEWTSSTVHSPDAIQSKQLKASGLHSTSRNHLNYSIEINPSLRGSTGTVPAGHLVNFNRVNLIADDSNSSNLHDFDSFDKRINGHT